ncbi:uncharacterized protein [Anabrus simplex]|uniref:uncharacterized protein n=1 Tax=Anabrus simplex TaxID=316456 RepID=UPI0035A26782
MCDIRTSCGFKAIQFGDLSESSCNKGRNLVVSGHVNGVEELISNGFGYITGKVTRQTSGNLPPYIVKLEIDQNRNVSTSECSCPAGARGTCKHVAAVVYYINNENVVSKTDRPQQWGKPSPKTMSTEKYRKGKRVEELFGKKTLRTSLPPFELTENILKHIPCSLRTMLRAEASTEIEQSCRAVVISLIDRVVNDVEREECEEIVTHLLHLQVSNDVRLPDKYTFRTVSDEMFLTSKVQVDTDHIIKISLDTLSQSGSPRWFQERKIRISASTKAHRIKTTRYNFDTLALAFVTESPIGRAALNNLSYGSEMESEAIECYGSSFGVRVIRCGLIIHKKQPWICGSPDGIVLRGNVADRVLEVKCPSSCKDKPIVDESGNVRVRYLYFDEQNNIQLKTSHMYYTQIQILMYITGLEKCDLYVYSKAQQLTIPIYQDNKYVEKYLTKMTKFYFNNYLPNISGIPNNNNDKNN